ncbi:Heat induced stress protein YflT [Paenibacillaceae bacterium GAS479]|nr:Heat induced stress protein YflT [Paenibacillaceae bacterium GAS479]
MAVRYVGIFENDRQAMRALEELQDAGYSRDELSVLTRDREHYEGVLDESGTMAPEGIAAGVTTGGLAGGTVGLLAGLGALAIPGVGPLLAAGPILAALGGAAVGASALGIVGGLVGMGFAESDAERFEKEVQEGRILVFAETAPEDARDVKAIMNQAGAVRTERIDDSVPRSVQDATIL